MYGMCRHFEITVGFLGKKLEEIRGEKGYGCVCVWA